MLINRPKNGVAQRARHALFIFSLVARRWAEVQARGSVY